MPDYFTKSTRWAFDLTSTAKQKGSALLSKPLASLTHTLTKVDPASLLEKARTFAATKLDPAFLQDALHYIGATNTRTTVFPSSSAPVSSTRPQKYRRVRRRDGTLALEAYRERDAGSETEDTDSLHESEEDDDEEDDYQNVGVEDARDVRGVGEPAVPDMSGLLDDEEDDDEDDDEEEDWVTVGGGPRYRGKSRGGDAEGRAIDALKAGFVPSYPFVEGEGVFARGLRELSAELEALAREEQRQQQQEGEEEEEEIVTRGLVVGDNAEGATGGGAVEQTSKHEKKASVVAVPELLEESGTYYSCHTFVGRQ